MTKGEDKLKTKPGKHEHYMKNMKPRFAKCDMLAYRVHHNKPRNSYKSPERMNLLSAQFRVSKFIKNFQKCKLYPKHMNLLSHRCRLSELGKNFQKQMQHRHIDRVNA